MNDLHPILLLPSEARFWYGFLATTFISAYIYVLNQIYDRESDMENRKLFLLADGYISLKEAWLTAAALLFGAFVFGAAVGRTFMILLLSGFILGTLYSLPPFRFKGRPFLDALSNAVGYALLNVAAGFVVVKSQLAESFTISLPYLFAVAGLYFNTTVPDIPGDRRANLITTGVFLGGRKTAALGSVAVLLTVLFALWPRFNPFMVVVGSVSLPFYLWAAIQGDESSVKLAYRISGVAFVLALIWKYPPFAVVSLVVLLALKLYYRIRFNLNYPSLGGR